jgi:hypothetical protein
MSTEVEGPDQAAVDAGLSLLALYRQSSTSGEDVPGQPDDAIRRCPNKQGFVLVNDYTGVVVPARCGGNRCPFCVRVNAHLVGKAISLANPERAMLLTSAGPDWQTIRRRVNRLNEYLRREGHTKSLLAYHVEPNPSGSGDHHVHAWQHGEYIPIRRLSHLAEKANLGQVARINAMKQTVGAGSQVTYGLKGISGVAYGLKLVEAQAEADTYLTANGNRLVHAQRGFWRDEGGNRLTGIRPAMRAAGRAGREDEREGTWVLMRETDIRSFLANSSGGR